MKPLLDAMQLSEMINVKYKTIYTWVYKKEMPFVKLGRLIRFDQNDIEKWRTEHKNNTSSQNTLTDDR